MNLVKSEKYEMIMRFRNFFSPIVCGTAINVFIMVMGYFYSFSGFSDLLKICLRLPITQVIRL